MGDTPFVILTLARSGSTHLVALLNQHPDITCYGEPLATGANNWHTASDRELIAAFTGTDTKATGYKILADQLDHRPDTLRLLCEVPGIRFVILQRSNQFERLRSLAQVKATGVWQRKLQSTSLPPRVWLDPKFCHDELVRADRFYSLCEELPVKAWVYYEELCQRQDWALEPVWLLLGVDPLRGLRPATIRLEQRPLDETVMNWSKLKEELRIDELC